MRRIQNAETQKLQVVTAPEYLTEEEFAKLGKFKIKTVQQWRYYGRNGGGQCGPRYCKIGKNIRYRLSDIIEWMESCIVDAEKGGE